MVSGGITVAIVLGSIALAEGPSVAASSAAPRDEIRAVLAKEGYPWYDGATDRVKPVLPWPDLHYTPGDRVKRFGEWLGDGLRGVARWLRWMNRFRIPWIGGFGDLIAIGLVMLLLTLVLVGLLELLRRYRPLGGDAVSKAALRAGSAQRIEGLPAGVRLDAADPWSEALRLRSRGDYSAAIIHLFGHQLLTLERLRQVRLVPGRTGRQLVRSVGDRQLRGLVEPTLRLFEAVYYGHRAISVEAFDAVWSRAEAFERLAAGDIR